MRWQSVSAIGCLFLLPFASACKDSSGPGTRIRLVHTGTTRVYESVRVSDCGADEWGADRLTGSAQLAPGESREITVSPGCHDLLLQATEASSAGGPSGIIVRGVVVESGQATEVEVI